jgi:hypothetical protein
MIEIDSSRRKTRGALTTRRLPWLDRIADYFGELRIVQFDRPEKIRPLIHRWRNQWADKPGRHQVLIQQLNKAEGRT